MRLLHSAILAVNLLLSASLAATAFSKSDPKKRDTPVYSYTDINTGIAFPVGFLDPTGFVFGLVLPQNPTATSDVIIQIVSPLTRSPGNTKRATTAAAAAAAAAGWAGLVLGTSMLNHPLIVAWPNGLTTSSSSPSSATGIDRNGITISPRLATEYDAGQVSVYGKDKGQRDISLQAIAKGTFVNATHISATFVCGGCQGDDSFAVGGAGTFGYAYSLAAVSEPGKRDTVLSDHSQFGEPYGTFEVSLGDAESATFEEWKGLGGGGSGSGSAYVSASAPASTSKGVAGVTTATTTNETTTAPTTLGVGPSLSSDQPSATATGATAAATAATGSDQNSGLHWDPETGVYLVTMQYSRFSTGCYLWLVSLVVVYLGVAICSM
ncbi:hypothetical protein B0T17DRAFT_619887 [Bombardia bombarda]|uniref:Cellobiose dehydrogenase-like cytochrome domain-containing protein n=1 Tax=Bombardia bombarda TaxID=252184 RepID=A0AA39WGN5_9PEZI|nr:hypothetical protein B0T17DRAFT_619887 [Bombardia bombarda]